MAAFMVDFMALLRQRQAVDLDHVVEHAGKDRHHLAILFPVEMRGVGEGLFHELGQVHRTQQAGAVLRQRLLAAVVCVQAVGIKGVNTWYLYIVNVFHAVCGDILHARDETFAIEATLIASKQPFEARCLVAVGEPDQPGKASRFSPLIASSCWALVG